VAHERLSAVDASFLHLEDRGAPMHVAGLMVFEGEPFFDDDGSFRLEECRRRVASRLHLVPRFRQRVMPVTAGLGRPVWVDHGDFDVAEHVRHAVLPPPGGDGELRGFMAAEQGLPLDRRRPLWELCFVEGLVGGRVALVVKVHHAMIDGAGGVEAAALLLLDMSAEAPIVVDVPPWVPEPPLILGSCWPTPWPTRRDFRR